MQFISKEQAALFKRNMSYRPQTETATTVTAKNWNGHKTERPKAGTATNLNGHKRERPQTGTPTTQTVTHKPKRPQTGQLSPEYIL